MARVFYVEGYVRPFEWIRDARLRDLVVDCAVNHGVDRATRWLQHACGDLLVDGIMGPKTRERVNGNMLPSERIRLQREVLKSRLRLYASLVAGDPSQAAFIRGWIERAIEFLP